MDSYAYGFPRLGACREYKKAIEDFWKGRTGEEAVIGTLSGIQKDNLRIYKKQGIDVFPDGEVSFYDPMLDTAILCGVYDPKNLNEYYDLCRGPGALEMTKWFNTNYHYLVTDFSAAGGFSFRNNSSNIALQFKRGDFPHFIGPFTYLKLSKGIKRADFRGLFLSLVKVYKEVISCRRNIQIDEPAFVMDLDREEVELIKEGYWLLAEEGSRITLVTYYDSVDFMEEFLSLPVSAVGLDFVRGTKSCEYILEKGFPKDKTLIAGLKRLAEKAGKIKVSTAAPLYHLPVSLSGEDRLDARLKKCLSFAEEKLGEIALARECFKGKIVLGKEGLGDFGRDDSARTRLMSLKESDFMKKEPAAERRRKQQDILNLPLFPTTTIGSFPQTTEVRKKRADYLKGALTEVRYKEYLYGEIGKLIRLQEDLGIDVLVHGEFERTDMVEFFAQRLSGIATTGNGWVISYGTRVYRPPIVFGDVSRPKPMTVEEIAYAQAKTSRPVKGMLTGAVTIIAWSYCREDVPLAETAYMISLSLREEIADYEKAGIKIVQVDEPAFREKAPIKRRDWESYFDWAVKSFNLATNTDPRTQIHTHMCYSEFGEIIDYINRLDCDVISIEASRSKGDIIDSFEKADFRRQIGLGVWDIHSPHVPSVKEMLGIVNRALERIPKGNFWLNPDCGLKTRDWPETKSALLNLMQAAKELRAGQA